MNKLFLVLLFVFGALQTGAQTEPVLSFGTIESGRKTPVTIAELLRYPRLVFDNDSFKVISYEVSIKSKANDAFLGPFRVTGSRLSKEATDALNAAARGGGTVYFDEIVVFGPDRRPRKYSSLIFQYSN